MVELKRRALAPFGRNIVILLIACLILSNCSRFVKMPVDDPQAKALVDRVVEANGDLKTIKGIGHLRFSTADNALTARIVWAVDLPDKIRIDMVTPLGQSSPMFIADGFTVTFFAGEKSARHLKQRQNALEPIVHVPVGIEFLTALLAGRLPSLSNVATRMRVNENGVDDIEFLDRWSMIVGRLAIDQMDQHPMEYYHYGPDGTIQYQISWRFWEVIQEYSLPRHIEITSADGTVLALQTQRYFCNPDLSDDLFSVPMTD